MDTLFNFAALTAPAKPQKQNRFIELLHQLVRDFMKED